MSSRAPTVPALACVFALLGGACGARTAADTSAEPREHVDASPPRAPDAGPPDAGAGAPRCRLSRGGDPQIVFRAADPARVEGPGIVWGISDVDLLAVRREGELVAPLWHRFDEELERGTELALPLDVRGPLVFSGLRRACFESPRGTSVVQLPPDPSAAEVVLPPGGCHALAASRALLALPDEAGVLAPQWIDYDIASGAAGRPEIASAVRGEFFAEYSSLRPVPATEAWVVGRVGERELELSVHYHLG